MEWLACDINIFNMAMYYSPCNVRLVNANAWLAFDINSYRL